MYSMNFKIQAFFPRLRPHFLGNPVYCPRNSNLFEVASKDDYNYVICS